MAALAGIVFVNNNLTRGEHVIQARWALGCAAHLAGWPRGNPRVTALAGHLF
jgi:hypothetical protein